MSDFDPHNIIIAFLEKTNPWKWIDDTNQSDAAKQDCETVVFGPFWLLASKSSEKVYTQVLTVFKNKTQTRKIPISFFSHNSFDCLTIDPVIWWCL